MEMLLNHDAFLQPNANMSEIAMLQLCYAETLGFPTIQKNPLSLLVEHKNAYNSYMKPLICLKQIPSTFKIFSLYFYHNHVVTNTPL